MIRVYYVKDSNEAAKAYVGKVEKDSPDLLTLALEREFGKKQEYRTFTKSKITRIEQLA